MYTFYFSGNNGELRKIKSEYDPDEFDSFQGFIDYVLVWEFDLTPDDYDPNKYTDEEGNIYYSTINECDGVIYVDYSGRRLVD